MTRVVTGPFLAALLAVAMLLSFMAAGSAEAQSESPTASATPTPQPQSTITIRFATDPEGQFPGTAHLTGPIHRLLADGVDCTPIHPPGDVEVMGYTIEWPRLESGLHEACTKGPPTSLHFEFLFVGSTQPFSVDLTWTGVDVDVVKVFPIMLLESPTPSPSPPLPPGSSTASASAASGTATPGQLPAAGGPVGNGHVDAGRGGFVTAGALILIAVFVISLVLGSRRMAG